MNFIARRQIRNSGATILLLALLSFTAFAQTAATGALTGTISDPTGAVIAGAQIKVTNEVTSESRTVSSGANGVYLVPLLPPGNYRVEITQTGFKSSSRADVTINVTETAKLDVQLAVGAATESVTIEDSPAIVQTESSALGRVINEKTVVSLPLVTRNYTQIIALSPGIITDVTNAAELGRGRGGLSAIFSGGTFVHGARAYDNNFQMNGVGINDFAAQDVESGGVAIPNPDTIQEFKVQTGQYDAAYGRNAGANVNLVTKGGSNDFHGNLFEFLRNNALNANDFFFNSAGQRKPVLKQNQFGFTLGGPGIKDKLYLFTSYQGTRQINGVASRRTVFSPPLTDDRSAAALGRLFAGRRGQLQTAFGGVGPAIAADGSNINPVALRLLQFKLPSGAYLFPTPQTINPARPFDSQGFSAFSDPSRFDEDQYMVNLDLLQTAKSKITGRFFDALSDQTVSFPQGNTPGFPRAAENRFLTFSLAHSYVFSPTLLHEVRFGTNRTRTTTTQSSPVRFSDVGIAAAEQNNDLPIFNIIGSYFAGGSFNAQRINNQFTVEDSLSYVRGKHSLRFGGNLTRAQRNFTGFRFNGQLIFLTMTDLLLGLSGPANGTGAFSNVFGAVDLIGLLDRAARSWEGALFAQDDFKVSSRLTINAGLRYERLGLFSDALGRLVAFDVTKANPNPPATGALDGYIVSKDYAGGAVPAGVTQADSGHALKGEGQNTFGPRLGFAWQMLPRSSRFVLRGGYGIYYTRLTGQASFQGNSVPPFAQLRANTGAANATATLAAPFGTIRPLSSFPSFVPYSSATNQSLTAVDPFFRPAMTQQYSLNVQTQLMKDLLLEVGYVGTRGTNLLRTRSVNQAQLASASNALRGVTTNTVANTRLRVPYLGWTPNGLLQIESAGSSYYNGLEVSLTKRFSRGLQFLASYTFSKSLDTDGANVVSTSNAIITVGEQTNERLRYGPSSFNRPQRLVVSYVYELPKLTKNQALGVLVNGWAVTGVTTFQTGQSLTIVGTNTNNLFGINGAGGDRAQLAAGCTHAQLVTSGSVNSKIGNYFNKSCFAPFPIIGDPEPTGQRIGTTFGNSGVGIVRGPAQRNFDLSLLKRFALRWPTEISNLEFRAEFFNAFNTTQFANPDLNFSNATFGQISATAVNPRIIQFALKYNF